MVVGSGFLWTTEVVVGLGYLLWTSEVVVGLRLIEIHVTSGISGWLAVLFKAKNQISIYLVII